MASHMVPKDKVTLKFTCPSCGLKKKEVYYVHRKNGDVSACRSYVCRGCGASHRIPLEDDACLNCGKRVDCLVVPVIKFYEDVKVRRERIPIWTERMQRVQEKGFVRVAKDGNIHKALGTFNEGKSYSSRMRRSKYTMWEVMLMLAYGYIEQFGPIGKIGCHYEITELGREAYHQLNKSSKRKGQLVDLPVDVVEKWVEYFISHQW